MKTIKYTVLGLILSSLLISSIPFSPAGKHFKQNEKVTFCETYTQEELFSKLDPQERLFTLIHLEGTDPESSRIGTCNETELSTLWDYVQSKAFRSRVQEDLVIAAGAEASGSGISLYAIRTPASSDIFPSQQDIDEVSVSMDNQDNYALLISFSETGAEKWASMTHKNKGRNLAILFEGKVLAAPRVMEEIKGGKCSISGNYTEDEIRQLKTALEN